MIYGYARISTAKQNIERQVRNIQREAPEAYIVKEVFTGTKFQGRREFEKLICRVHQGDTIIFDSVSRMSRTAEEGFKLYQELFRKNIELVFLKEPHINTEVYRRAIQNQIQLTGGMVDAILEGVNKYMMLLAQEQIKIAFEQSEKEVADLHQRTKEGIETARINGKQIGLPKGTILETKKGKEAKTLILKHNKSFGGTLNNEETWKLCHICKTSFYKYKKELFKNAGI